MKFKELSNQRKFLFRYRVRILTTSIFVLVVLLGSALVYSITSSFFMTPIETVVGKSNQQLRDHYDRMVVEYNLLDSVVGNLKSRDEIVYKQLFGANLPDIQQSELLRERKWSREALEQFSFDELSSILLKEVDSINQKASNVAEDLGRSRDLIDRRNENFKGIPSMQPINNADLSKSITPSGMRINPFVKSFFLHKGIDYSIPEETRVFATADGTVQTVMASGTSGGTVQLNHYGNYSTSYGNLSKVTVKAGQRVTRGTIIGYSGNTGTSFLPHLHYEVKYGNKNLDPFDFFFAELTVHQLEKMRNESAQNIQSFD